MICERIMYRIGFELPTKVGSSRYWWLHNFLHMFQAYNKYYSPNYDETRCMNTPYVIHYFAQFCGYENLNKTKADDITACTSLVNSTWYKSTTRSLNCLAHENKWLFLQNICAHSAKKPPFVLSLIASIHTKHSWNT